MKASGSKLLWKHEAKKFKIEVETLMIQRKWYSCCFKCDLCIHWTCTKIIWIIFFSNIHNSYEQNDIFKSTDSVFYSLVQMYAKQILVFLQFRRKRYIYIYYQHATNSITFNVPTINIYICADEQRHQQVLSTCNNLDNLQYINN